MSKTNGNVGGDHAIWGRTLLAQWVTIGLRRCHDTRGRLYKPFVVPRRRSCTTGFNGPTRPRRSPVAVIGITPAPTLISAGRSGRCPSPPVFSHSRPFAAATLQFPSGSRRKDRCSADRRSTANPSPRQSHRIFRVRREKRYGSRALFTFQIVWL